MTGLNVTAGGAVTQGAGDIKVTGATVISAAGFGVTLATAANELADLSVTGNATDVRSAVDMTVTALTVPTDNAITLVSTGALTLPATAINTGTANLTLSSGKTLTTVETLKGTNVSLTGATGISLTKDVTAAGTLSLNSTNTDITQAATSVITATAGATTVAAGTGKVTLDTATNDFQSVALNSGGAVTLRDANTVELGAASTGSLAVTATLIKLNGGVTTTTTQLFAGDVQLIQAATTVAGTTIQFGGKLDGTTAGVEALTLVNSGQATFTGAVGSSVPLASLTTGTGKSVLGAATVAGAIVLGGAADLSGALITTDSKVTVAGATTLTGNASVSSGTGLVTFTGAIDGDAAATRSLKVTSTGAITLNAVGTTKSLTTLTLDGVGATALKGNVTTAAGQQYGGAVTLSQATTTLTSTTVQFDGKVDGTVAGAQALTLANSGMATLTGAVGGDKALSALTIGAGGATLGGGTITTTGAQNFNGPVTLNASTTLASTGNAAITLASTVEGKTAGAEDLIINTTGATKITGAAGSVTPLKSLTTNAGGTTSIANVTTQGAITLGDDVTLTGTTYTTNGNAFSVAGTTKLSGNSVAIEAGVTANVTFGQAISTDSNGLRALTVNAGGVTKFGSNVGSKNDRLLSLTTDAGGSTILGGDVFTLKDQTYNDNVSFIKDATLSTTKGGNIIFNAAVNLNFDIDFKGATPTFNGAISGQGQVALAPEDDKDSIGVAGAAGDFQVSQALLNQLASLDGPLAVGTASGTGAITVGVDSKNGLTLPDVLLLQSNSGTVTFVGPVTGNNFDLKVTTTSLTDIQSAMTGLGALTISGPTQIRSVNITGNAAQTFGSTLVLAGSGLTTLTGTTISVAGKVDGTGFALESLNLANSGATTFSKDIGATVALGSLTTGTGTATLQSVTTVNDQFYQGNVVVGANATKLSGANLTFKGKVDALADGVQALEITPSVSATFDKAVGSTGRLASLNSSTSAEVRLNDITTTGGQSYKGNVVLNANAVLTGTTLTFTERVDAQSVGVQTLSVVNSDALVFSKAVGGSTTLNSLTTGTGKTSLFNVQTTGNQSYGGDLTLSDTGTFTGAAMTFKGKVDAASDGAQSLLLKNSGTATFEKDVGGTTRVNTFTGGPGTVQLANVSTIGGIALSGNAVLSGAVANAGGDFRVDGSTTVQGTGATINSFNLVTLTGAIEGAADNTQSLAITSGGASNITLGNVGATNRLTTLTLNTGRAQLVGARTSGDIAINGNATLAGQYVTTGGGKFNVSGNTDLGAAPVVVSTGAGAVTFTGTVDGVQSLQVTSSGDTTFTGKVGSVAFLTSLTTDGGGKTNLPGVVNTTGVMQLNDEVVLGTATALTGSSITLGSLTAGANNLTTRSDALAVTGTASGTKALDFGASAPGVTTAVGNGVAGTLQLDAALLAKFGSFDTLSIGRSDSIAAMNVGTVSLPTATTLLGQTSPVTISGAVDGNGKTLRLQTNGLTTFSGAVTNLASLFVPFKTELSGATIGSTGDQTYVGEVTLAGAGSSLSGANLNFSATLDGGQALTLTATGTTTFSQAVGGTTKLASLNTTGAVQIDGGSIRTTGTQTHAGAVTLGADTTFSGGDVNLQGTVNGARALTVDATGTASFGAAVGGTNAPTTLRVTAASIQLNGGTVTTAAASGQTYNGNVLLGKDTTLAGGDVILNGKVDGAQSLTSKVTGVTLFVGRVGSGTALTALSVDNAAVITTDIIATTGNQDYKGAVTVQLASALAGQDLNFASTVDGPAALTLNSTGTATLAGAVGFLQNLDKLVVTAAAINLPGSVSTVNGQTYSGPVNLTAATTLTGNDIAFNGKVDGAQTLNVNAAGLTRFAGAVGAGTKLASVTTSALGSTQIGANISTSGDQSYNDPVTMTANAALLANVLTFGQAFNGGIFSTDIQAAAINFNGTVAGSGSLLLAPDTAAGTIGLTGAAGNLQITQSTLDKFTGFSDLTIGRTDGTGAITANALVLPTHSLLRSQTGPVNLTGTVDSTGSGAKNLTVTSGGLTTLGGSVGGLAALGNLSITNNSALNTAAITTSGAQTYSGATGITADATLRGSGVNFGGVVTAGARDLSIFADAVTMAATANGTGTVLLAPLNADGSIGVAGAAGTLQVSQGLLDTFAGMSKLTLGRVDGTGAITSNAVTLPTDVVVQSKSAAVSFNGTIDSAASGAKDLTVNTSGLTSLAGAVGSTKVLDVLSISGGTQIGANITTSGDQTYSGPVSMTANAALRANVLTFAQAFNGGIFSTDIQAAAINFNGTVAGSGSLLLAPDTAAGTIGLTGAAGNLQITQSTLDKFTGFSDLTIGRTDGTGAITANALVLPTHSLLRSQTGPVNLTGTVDSTGSGAKNLTVTSGGLTTLGGSVGGLAALGNLSITNNSALNTAAITTSGAQTYSGATGITADATLRGSGVNFGGVVTAGARDLSIFADAVTMAATANGTGTVLLAPLNADGSIGVAGAAGTLQVSQGLLDTFAGMSKLTLGRVDGTGAITSNAVTLPTDVVVQSKSAAVSFNGTIDSAASGAKDLTVSTSGLTSLAGAVGSTRVLDVLSIAGTSQLGAGSIATSGAQTYSGAASLSSDNTLTGSAINFGSTVDGARALTLNAATTTLSTNLGSTTALTSLTTDASGTTSVGGNVSTTGAQTWGDKLALTGNSNMTASAVTFNGSVDGAQALSVNAAAATLNAAVGSGTKLTSVSVSGTTALNGGAVTTSAAQTYTGAVSLGADSVLGAGSLTFGSTIDGARALTINSVGLTTLNGAVGVTTKLNSLDTQGGGTVALNAPTVITTNAQNYSGALQLGSAATTLSAGSLKLAGAVSGAKDLTLSTDALTAGSIAGSGVLTIQPRDNRLSVGVAGANGNLKVSQQLLDSAAGFASHVIGRTDGTGDINANTMVLKSNTTLQSDTGNVSLNGAVDGGFDLALNSGATTRIAGPVGASVALRSLKTDNNVAAADWNGKTGERTLFDLAGNDGKAHVTTTGAQTYADPLTATVALALVGGAITAEQATSQFDGKVEATADSLRLKSGVAIKLGNVTLANGGNIETAGVLDLGGALILNGGTLALKSTAVPTAGTFKDEELKARTGLAFGTVPLDEASATIFQSTGSTITTANGSTLSLRASAGGTIDLSNAGNKLAGGLSAVSGQSNDVDLARFNNQARINLGLVRINASEIHVAGAPSNDQAANQAGIEADFVRISSDQLTTGTTSQIRVRLPYNSAQGTKTSVPGLTLVLGTEALKTLGGFGGNAADTWIQVQLGGAAGGFLTVLPKGKGADPGGTVLLGGPQAPVPFYDGTGKLAEVRVFYNGATTQTAQETGALSAVTAVVEESRQTRFEEAVRTENVTARLRSGVIAEVGSGRPATVGREGIRPPQTCNVKQSELKCE